MRQTEALVQETIAAADRGPVGVVGSDGTVTKPPRRASDHVTALEQEFRAALGLRVKITHDARGRGKVVIAFGSHKEVDQIRQHICDAAPRRCERARRGRFVERDFLPFARPIPACPRSAWHALNGRSAAPKPKAVMVGCTPRAEPCENASVS